MHKSVCFVIYDGLCMHARYTNVKFQVAYAWLLYLLKAHDMVIFNIAQGIEYYIIKILKCIHILSNCDDRFSPISHTGLILRS
jgi:hypothetical protein